jgi:Holliday junction resolvase
VSASQRTKGHSFEREIVNALKPTFPDAKRGLSQSRDGSETCDVEGVPGVWLECKRRKQATTATILDAIKQATEATNGRVPVVIVRSDREEPIVCMRLSDFTTWYLK